MKSKLPRLLPLVAFSLTLGFAPVPDVKAESSQETQAAAREGVPPAVRLSPAQEARLSPHLNASRRIALSQMADAVRRNPQAATIANSWRSFLQSFPTQPPEPDRDALITWLLRTAFLESEQEIQAYEMQVDQFDAAQLGYRKEVERAYSWVDRHQAAGNQKIDPPFLPDHRLQRPKPIMGPKPPAISRAMATRKEVGAYALGLDRRRARLLEDLQLVELAVQRAVQRQRQLLDQAPEIRQSLLNLGTR